MRARRLIFAGFATTSCWFGSTPPVRAPATEPAVLLGAKPWPASAPACTISERAIFANADCDAFTVDVWRSPNDAAPVAELESVYGQGRATWSDLPLVDAYPGPFSRVEIAEGGLHVRGTAKLDAQSFRLRRDFAIDRGHMWIAADAAVTILGTSGDRVGIRVKTPFDAPSTWETLVPCDQLGAPDARPSRSSGHAFAQPIAPAISIRAAPNDREVIAVHADTSPPFFWLGSQNGFVHVVTQSPPDAALVVDGWVRANDVREDPIPDRDRDSGDCNDLVDRCFVDRAAHAADVLVGAADPEAGVVGTLDANTGIVLGKEHVNGFVSFTTANEIVHAKAPRKFWIAERDVKHAAECDE